MFPGKKGNMGMTLFLGVIVLNIILYCVIYAANADANFDSVGDNSNLQYNINGTTDQDISSSSVTHWYSGFQVSVFDLPWYVNIFYVTLQGVLLSLGLYAMIRGLS